MKIDFISIKEQFDTSSPICLLYTSDQLAGDSSADTSIYEAEAIEEIFHAIETVFQGLQQRQKPMLSDMITIKLCDQISEKQSRQYCFISKEIMDAWTTTGVLPSQRDIAKKYGRDETSMSLSLIHI